MYIVASPSAESNHAEGNEETISGDITPRRTAEEEQSRLKRRVKKLMKKECNRFCLDCSKPRPKWATLLAVPTATGAIMSDPYVESYYIGGFCCLECSGAHRRIGTHISFVRSIELDTLKEIEVEALERGGNKLVNDLFEGKLLSFVENKVDTCETSSAAVAKPDPTSGQKRRETYIRNKYEKKKFLDLKVLANLRQSLINPIARNPDDSKSPMSDDSPSPLSVDAKASPLQLQIFTSSPRTMALIDKYMNPKPKKKRFRNRITKKFRRRSRSRHFKDSLLGLRGIVGMNPHLKNFETSSEGSGQSPRSDNDERGDNDSVTSSRSTMSATFRRRFLRKAETSTITPRGSFSPMPVAPSSLKGTRTGPLRFRNFTPTPKENLNELIPYGLRRTPTPVEADLTPLQKFSYELLSKDNSVTSPISSNGSFRSRMLLSTPKSTPKRCLKKNNSDKKNGSGKKSGSGKKKLGTFFFAEDTVSLGVVKESPPDMTTTDGDESIKDEINALKAWSCKLDSVVSKMFKKRHWTFRRGSCADECTSLIEERENQGISLRMG